MYRFSYRSGHYGPRRPKPSRVRYGADSHRAKNKARNIARSSGAASVEAWLAYQTQHPRKPSKAEQSDAWAVAYEADRAARAAAQARETAWATRELARRRADPAIDLLSYGVSWGTRPDPHEWIEDPKPFMGYFQSRCAICGSRTGRAAKPPAPPEPRTERPSRPSSWDLRLRSRFRRQRYRRPTEDHTLEHDAHPPYAFQALARVYEA